MPSAGAAVPPTIVPLRKPIPGQPFANINTSTYIELASDDPDLKVYFTTDGSKPNPYQLKVNGRETTFRYRGPFTLKPGKRTLKCCSVSRNGITEPSNVVTKTFFVEDIGPPASDIDLDNIDLTPGNDIDTLWNSPSKKSKKKKVSKKRHEPKEAWTTSNSTGPVVPDFLKMVNGVPPEAHHDNNAVKLPEGSCAPVNYSGTQINFWGVNNGPPGSLPSMPTGPNLYDPYFNREVRMGVLTEKMIQNLEQPKLTVTDVKHMIEDSKRNESPPPPPPQPAIEYPIKKEPELNPISPGSGDWRAQLDHIYAHLIEQAKNNTTFRTAIAEPKMGKIVHADFDVEDDAYLLTVSFARPGHKPKPKPKPVPVEPKQTMTSVARKAAVSQKMAATTKAEKKESPAPPPPKKVAPKKPPPKEEPYFKTEEYEAEGTLKPWQYFDAETDCEVLRKAMKGMGTDEDAIINTLPYRSSTQRTEVALMYKTMFGKDLIDDLKGETSGGFQDLLEALCMSAPDYDAFEINKAIKGLGTDEDALVEILCTRTNAQIKAMKQSYKKLYKVEMEKDVKGDTSGNFRKLLVSQISGNRSEDPKYDLTSAKADAKALFDAGEGKWGTDESKFNMILCQRSFPHLRAVFEEYSKISKKDIEDAIKSEFSGDIMQGLLTVVRCIKKKPAYFAKKLQKSMKGLGTDDSALVRVVVSRCETDMVQIMQSFQEQFNATLDTWISDDTSGDYKETLLALIGARVAPSPSAAEVEATEGPPEIEEVEEENIPQEGSVKPADPFDPKKDSEVLRKAMKGLGTDEDAIIQVWGKRSNEQRQELKKTFKTMFGKDLMKELKSELGGKLKQLTVALGDKPDEYDANELRKAMKGLGTDEEALVEVLCTRDNEEIQALREAYQRVHQRKLEDDITSETSGNLKRLLVSMVQANRPSGNTIDRRKARKDAKDLFEAGEEKFGTDESRFNVILCSRSYPQLRATFEEYEKVANKDISDSIKEEMSGDLKKGMLIIVDCIRNKAQQFAKRIHESMKGLGTDDDTLIRVSVSRSEIDMVQIKEQFQTLYDKSLGEWVAGDTSGDYKKLLMLILGEEGQSKKK